MGIRVSAALWAVVALFVLVALTPSGAAQDTGPCPVAHITDASGDVSSTSPADTGDIDVLAACFALETSTSFELVVVVAEDISPTATQVLLYDFHFKIGTTDIVAGADIRMGSATATGSAAEVAVDGAALSLTVPKENVGYDNEQHVGTALTSLFVETETTTAGGADLDQIEGSDRAPDDGFGQDYIGGSQADASQDTDGDGVPDRQEIENGTDPKSLDGDGDGLADGPTVTFDAGSENATRYEGAGITSEENDDGTITFFGEASLGTNATMADTDGDGLIDGGTAIVEEGSARAVKLANASVVPTRTEGTNSIYAGELSFNGDPLDPDGDGDGLQDGEEVQGTRNQYQETSAFSGYPGSTDPGAADTDGDGLSDFDEVTGTHVGDTFSPTDPNLADTDGDGLSDFEEVMGMTEDGAEFPATDPTQADSDGDGVNDGPEVDQETDPTDPSSNQIIQEGPAEATDWVYALLSTVLLLAVILLSVFGILVRWG